ncbi:MAG TPA: hypothetical protein VL171_17740 [Verrucomicrobiae bacterium]|nr:hypothetical protein [Verrucomicrobiae bacterium]
MNSQVTKIGGGLLAVILVPSIVHACACGCGIFDVGGSGMLPDQPGGMAFVEYDYMNQTRNWHDSSSAPGANNDDKRLESQFTTVGLQYMFNRAWGVQAELPYTFRTFKATDDATGRVATHSWGGLGDVRLRGIYTGFSEDMSTGVSLGLKLPTGSFREDTELVDRDTQIGTGGLEVLLGGFHRRHLGREGKWDWFNQFQLELPTYIQDHYRPGIEFDAATGIVYTGFTVGGVRISPLGQILFSDRASDSGANSAPDNTGYQRVLLSPGVEFHIHPVKIYFDAEFPVYQNFIGNQLAAPVMFKATASFMF